MKWIPSLLLIANMLAAPLTGRAEQLAVVTKTIQPREMSALHYLELYHGTERFSLVPPKDYRMQVDGPAGTLRFSSLLNPIAVTLHFSTNDPRSVLASGHALRAHAVPELAQAELREEFAAFAGGSAGKGVELSHAVHAHSKYSRAVVIPTAKGCVSFVVTAPATEKMEAQQIFNGVLTSFQPMHASSKR